MGRLLRSLQIVALGLVSTIALLGLHDAYARGRVPGAVHVGGSSSSAAAAPFGLGAAPEEVAALAGGGAALSLSTPLSRITSDASGGVSRVNLPNGTYVGQIHYVYWLTEGAGGDSVRCYPATFADGTYSSIGFRVLYGYVWTGATWKQFIGTSIT